MQPNFVPAPPHPARTSRGAGFACLGVSGAGLAIAGLVGFFVISGGPCSWSAAAPGCFVDANGDGVDEVVGMSGSSAASANKPTIVDGKTGKVLWSGASVKDGDVFCLSKEWFVVAHATFTFEIRSAKKPDEVIARRGPDKLQSVARGKDCFSLKFADGTSTGVRLPSGHAGECLGDHPTYPHDAPGMLGHTEEETSVEVGDRRYFLRKKGAGTPMLTVEVTRGGTTLWKRPLEWASPTFTSGIAVGNGVVALWAAKPSERDTAVLVGLDAETGNPKFTHDIDSSVSNSINFMGFNGRHVVVAWWTSLHAYDTKDGEVVWMVGSTGHSTRRR